MKQSKFPVTAAIRVLRAAGVDFTGHLYHYVDGGGTEQVARELGIAEHSVIKTLIMEDDAQSPMIVLMHGDRQVATQALARKRGVKRVVPCQAKTADRHSGYQVGGTSPFGTRHPMPVYAEESINALPSIFINGGKRGFIIELSTADAFRLLQPTLLTMAA